MESNISNPARKGSGEDDKGATEVRVALVLDYQEEKALMRKVDLQYEMLVSNIKDSPIDALF
jgi:outer membrane scaffolding protein for murein synthesis (MipA/OmpV family)